MPDGTPADVKTSPSRTKIASGSTMMSGKARASNRVSRQCVVARRPLSRPACARMKDPVQMDPRRRVRPAIDLTAATSSGSIARAGTLSLPATSTVSADAIDEMLSLTPSRALLDVAGAAEVFGVFFVVEPDRAGLVALEQRLRDGRLRPIVGAVCSLAEAPSAFDPARRVRGKMVVAIADGD